MTGGLIKTYRVHSMEVYSVGYMRIKKNILMPTTCCQAVVIIKLNGDAEVRKIWQEDAISSLSSYKNLKEQYKEIIPEIVKFVEVNQPILSEWVLDQWVNDRNLGRVQL